MDSLFWLRDDKRKNAEVLAHLEAENAYTEYCTGHLKAG
jgi:oligopeptidase B